MNKISEDKMNRTRELYRSGMTLKEMAEALGLTVKAVDYRLRKYGIRKEVERKAQGRETLCWTCKYAAMGDYTPCPWHRKPYTPRDDWTAVRMDIETMPTKKGKESYLVIDCPGFEKG